jgi:MoaA/NifB/PqqE/SkfB family radical SAM enzyme
MNTSLNQYPTDQYPSFLSIFLTTRCNLRCFICNRDEFKGQDLKYENIYKLTNAIKYAEKVDLTGWGECFLYPRFDDILEYIYSLNHRKDLIFITTNGTRLSEHTADLLNGHLNMLIISLNAATAETYNRDMKNGNFEKTLSAIRTFLSRLEPKELCKVELHFVAHAENLHEIPEFVNLAKTLDIAAVSIGNFLISRPKDFRYSLLHIKHEYNLAVNQAQELGKKLGVSVAARKFFVEGPRPNEKCKSPFEECFIGVDGRVSPCCFSGGYYIGNVYETCFEDVWFGEKYRKLRERRYLSCCQKCVPFTPFDEYNAHFTAHFKETEEFDKCLAADALNREGVDLLNAGDMEGAQIAFLNSLQHNSQLATVHNNLGLITYSQGKYDVAIRHFAKALQLEPLNRVIIENIEKASEVLRAVH